MKGHIVVIGVALLLMACMSCADIYSGMESADRATNEITRDELVAYMSLEIMFPDKQVRELAKAAGKGKLEIIDASIEKGVDVNARGKSNATPLFWAMNNIAGFERLLELGADPNVVFEDGSSVIHWAVGHKDSRFLMTSLDHGGNPDLVAGWFKETPIFEAMGPDNKNKIDILLNAGADINFQASYGNTPIMVAAELGQFDTVFKLLSRGADYTITMDNGDDLADVIRDRRKTMDPENELTRWMERVIEWLKDRGIQ